MNSIIEEMGICEKKKEEEFYHKKTIFSNILS